MLMTMSFKICTFFGQSKLSFTRLKHDWRFSYALNIQLWQWHGMHRCMADQTKVSAPWQSLAWLHHSRCNRLIINLNTPILTASFIGESSWLYELYAKMLLQLVLNYSVDTQICFESGTTWTTLQALLQVSYNVARSICIHSVLFVVGTNLRYKCMLLSRREH